MGFRVNLWKVHERELHVFSVAKYGQSLVPKISIDIVFFEC